MSDYIDLAVVGKVIAAGLLFGAVLPLVFATGLRALSADTVDTVDTVRTGETGDAASYRSGFQVTRSPAALGLAAVCFAVVAASVGFGIYLIMHKS